MGDILPGSGDVGPISLLRSLLVPLSPPTELIPRPLTTLLAPSETSKIFLELKFPFVITYWACGTAGGSPDSSE